MRYHHIIFFITIDAEQHRGARALLETIEQQQLSADVVNIGPVGHEDLRSAYQSVRICLLPTVLESMSGTYLEALQYRLPIVTTDRDFARESCGSAATYFEPGEVEVAIDLLRAAAASAPPERTAALSQKPRRWVDVGGELAALVEAIPRPMPGAGVIAADRGEG